MNTDSPAAAFLVDPVEHSSATEIDQWQGQTLAPLGLGIRQQWLAVTESNDTPIFMSASLVWLLLLGQKAYETAQIAKLHPEQCADAVRAAVLVETASKVQCRVNVMRFMDGMGTRKVQRECLDLAARILGRADASEPEDKAEVPATVDAGKGTVAPGKSQAGTKARNPPTRRKQKSRRKR